MDLAGSHAPRDSPAPIYLRAGLRSSHAHCRQPRSLNRALVGCPPPPSVWLAPRALFHYALSSNCCFERSPRSCRLSLNHDTVHGVLALATQRLPSDCRELRPHLCLPYGSSHGLTDFFPLIKTSLLPSRFADTVTCVPNISRTISLMLSCGTCIVCLSSELSMT